MSSRLEDLTQHVLCDPRVQPSNVQCPFVRLGGSSARNISGCVAGGRQNAGGHGRANRGGNGVIVLGDDDGRELRRRHMLLRIALVATIVAWGARGGRWRRHGGRRSLRVSHGCDYEAENRVAGDGEMRESRRGEVSNAQQALQKARCVRRSRRRGVRRQSDGEGGEQGVGKVAEAAQGKGRQKWLDAQPTGTEPHKEREEEIRKRSAGG